MNIFIKIIIHNAPSLKAFHTLSYLISLVIAGGINKPLLILATLEDNEH